MRRYPIEIAEYNSALIRAEAIAAGITHMREIDRVRSRGVLYRLLALPHCGGEIRIRPPSPSNWLRSGSGSL